MTIAHWDDVEKRRRSGGPMSATWSNLGVAAGSHRAGVARIEMEAGEIPTPAHVHGEAEEIHYVLAGSGLSWQDGKSYEIRAGDCLVHKPFHEAHTLRAGENGLDVLAFGGREYTPTGALPRANAAWMISGFVEVQDTHPWEREPAFEFPEPSGRPATIVAAEAVEPNVRGGRRRRDLGLAAGSQFTGLKHIDLDAGTLSGPPHCHSAEEELFVILDGEGTLQLGGEEHPVRRGHVVARPPGTGIAHAFRAGPNGLTLLAWGTREPNDICWYPRSDKIFWRGVGVIGRIEQLDYWDGEELED